MSVFGLAFLVETALRLVFCFFLLSFCSDFVGATGGEDGTCMRRGGGAIVLKPNAEITAQAQMK